MNPLVAGDTTHAEDPAHPARAAKAVKTLGRGAIVVPGGVGTSASGRRWGGLDSERMQHLTKAMSEGWAGTRS